MRKRISHLIVPVIMALMFMIPAAGLGATTEERVTDLETDVQTTSSGLLDRMDDVEDENGGSG